MAKKQMMWKTKGMNQDLSVSAFNPEFSFENMNLRLSTNEGNTLLSWVNERGTAEIAIGSLKDYAGNDITTQQLQGFPVGTALLNNKLILFTHRSDNTDFIYVLEYADTGKTVMSGKLLFSGYLNFSTEYPLETLVRYENDSIQKVYWTDGYNQPRMINIAAPLDTVAKWNTSNDTDLVCTWFDFVSTISDFGALNVEKELSGGTFAPGVIQYAFTYINNYGQQSNIVQVSPLFYISHSDRGASPEEKVNCSFKIIIDNPDKNFDFIRVYSIQRTAVNSDAFVKEINTLPINTILSNTVNREEVYATEGTYEDFALPKKYINEEWKRIITARLTNGTYENIIIPPSDPNIPETFDGDTTTLFTDQAGNHSNPFYFYEFVDFIKSYMVHSDFFSYVKFTKNISTSINVSKGWSSNYLSINGSNFYEYQLHDKYFVYDYDSGFWFITDSIPVTNVTAEKQEVTESMVITDNGTGGSTVDPYELLFIGGKEITALTMTEKDNVLFMGNIEEKNHSVSSIQEYFTNNRNNVTIEFSDNDPVKRTTLEIPSSFYGYNCQLNRSLRSITTFKGMETYRFGFQLQRHTGEWSEPIFIKDATNNLYPKIGALNENWVNLISASTTLSVSMLKEAIGEDLYSTYCRIRPLIVYPTANDRSVLCQGVLNPTLFNVDDRVSNTPFAQPSWFFRPYTQNNTITPPEESYDYSRTPVSTKIIESGQSCIDTGFDAQDRVNVCVMLVRVTDGSRYTVQNIDHITMVKAYYFSNGLLQRSVYKDYRIITSVEIERNLFAIVSDDSWVDTGRTNNPTYSSQSDWAYMETDYVNINRSQIIGYYNNSQVYNKLVSEGGVYKSQVPLYYVKPAGSSPNDSKLMFNIGGFHYTVSYPAINMASQIYASTRGVNIPFKHYATLIEQGITDHTNECEIQGSKNRYLSVTGVSGLSDSNTQFFIDQSIVTLNSPDIEMDTEVQTFKGEGLALRVVGIVPVTGSMSSHRITHGSLPIKKINENNNDALVGRGELSYNVYQGNLNLGGNKRLVNYKLWNDLAVNPSADNEANPIEKINFYVYPWQKQGPLNNDWREEAKATSVLKTKKEATLLYSYISEYIPNNGCNYINTDVQMCLQENSMVHNVRLRKQKVNSADINYYPNIDKVLTNPDGYVLPELSVLGNEYDTVKNRKYYNPVSMKYKSGSHAVIALKAGQGLTTIPIMPYALHATNDKLGEFDTTVPRQVFWGDTITNSQGELNISNCQYKDFSFLLLGELYIPDENILNRFGGDTDSALKSNKWQIGGDSVDLVSDSDGYIQLKWLYGDTYFQRYDCLKTYPFTDEDTNQLVEILSFMCETHVNIDGRYDRNRGQVDNTNMNPQNFNLLNPVYSQKDNFFTYRILNTDTEQNNKYVNQVIWSKTKNNGADVDIWTNITLANSLELDGDKGNVKKLCRLDNQLIAFQDTGISQILYNENAQISTTSGVPIEIANSGKVDGKRYLSNTVGCSNKWAMATTPNGIYFMDSNDKSIYLFNGQLKNISVEYGFNTWCKSHIPSSNAVWNPNTFDSFVAYYDKLNQDVLWINKDIALAFSEKLGSFTSFYDYGNTPYLVGFEDTELWIEGSRFYLESHRISASQYTDTEGKHMVNGNAFLLPCRSSGNYLIVYNNPQSSLDYSTSSFYYSVGIRGNADPEGYGGYDWNFGDVNGPVLLKNIATQITNYEDAEDYIFMVWPGDELIPSDAIMAMFEKLPLWKHQAGKYCNFFGTKKPYWMTLVGNPEPQIDKIFTNIEFRASVDGDGELNQETGKFTPALPFDSLEVWNEYQHGTALLQNKSGSSQFQHHTKDDPATASLKRKFRIWRSDIPRDNAPIDAVNEARMGIYRKTGTPHYNDRMRNPWLYLKLKKNAATGLADHPKAEVHDLMMTYFD